jgi:hypothetical protein
VVALSTLACGQEFAGMADAAAGSGGAVNADGGAGERSGGAAGRGGMGAAGDLALGGKPPLGGQGGSGGDPVVQAPPIPLEGLELWLRADHEVGQVGGLVSSWKDGSEHARDALQTEAGFRPKLVEGALSGKPALVFDGVDDFLDLPELDADISQGVSMFIAFEQQALGTCGAWFEASNGRELQELHFGDWQSSVIYEIAESWINDTNFPLLMAEPQITGAIHGADKVVKLRTNGSSAGQGMVTLSPAGLTRKYVYVGKTLYTDCAYFKGSIGEILLYSRPVTSQEMLDIEGYLQSKWACCGH